MQGIHARSFALEQLVSGAGEVPRNLHPLQPRLRADLTFGGRSGSRNET